LHMRTFWARGLPRPPPPVRSARSGRSRGCKSPYGWPYSQAVRRAPARKSKSDGRAEPRQAGPASPVQNYTVSNRAADFVRSNHGIAGPSLQHAQLRLLEPGCSLVRSTISQTSGHNGDPRTTPCHYVAPNHIGKPVVDSFSARPAYLDDE
jgi:hypothetical protein